MITYSVLKNVHIFCAILMAWPDTFQWFAPIYWLEALDPPFALEKLRQTPQEVAALLNDLSEQAMTQEPQDGGWAIRNILIHLRDAQDVLDYRHEITHLPQIRSLSNASNK